jgi:hypothetical protein
MHCCRDYLNPLAMLQFRPMRRLILIFLLVVFPLQVSWAVASAYCAHEANPVSIHPGHHQHAAGFEADTLAGDNTSSGIDVDCGDCHFSNVAIVSSAADGAITLVSHVRSGAGLAFIPLLRPTRPERPNWQPAA